MKMMGICVSVPTEFVSSFRESERERECVKIFEAE